MIMFTTRLAIRTLPLPSHTISYHPELQQMKIYLYRERSPRLKRSSRILAHFI